MLYLKTLITFYLTVDRILGKLLKSVSVCFPTVRRVAILMLFCQKAIEYGIDSFGIGRVIHTVSQVFLLHMRRDQSEWLFLISSAEEPLHLHLLI